MPIADPDPSKASPNVKTLRSHVRRETTALELATADGRQRVLMSRSLASYSIVSLDHRSVEGTPESIVAVDGIELMIQRDMATGLDDDPGMLVTIFFDAADVAAIHAYLGGMLDQLVRFPRSFEDAAVQLAIAGYSFPKSAEEAEADDSATLQAARAGARRARAVAGRSKKAKRAKKRSGASR